MSEILQEPSAPPEKLLGGDIDGAIELLPRR